ncbi:MAG: NAD-dependent succinate-semialdehyde dehydrogenase [Azospirillaceae bacterium]|nr:NAD-dependent succinate-semialdehyde dehydrogenase [Azospirillaceae bacterium]
MTSARYPRIQLYIDGAWTDGTAERWTDVINPATEEVIGRVPHASVADLDRALAAAQRGFALWRDTPVAERTRILKTAARILRERSAEIGRIMTLEQGKLVAEATGEAQRVAGTLEWDTEEARRAYGRIIPTEPNLRLYVQRQPIGPVAAFVPWNFPAGSPMRKIAAALAAGCSVVLKSAEETPGTAVELVRCFADAGLPAGVLNLVFGDPPAISSHLIASPIIRLVAFTGSIPVGKLLAEQAARRMKPAIMELGGHAPVVVCADANPVAAAKACAAGKFINAGQVCTSPSRFIVHESIHDRFVDAFVDAARSLPVGDGFGEGIKMGPLANARRLAAAEQLVTDAKERGARVRFGGNRIGNRGFFFEPTVLDRVPLDARIMVEEPFAPVAPVVPFTDLDTALDIANGLPFGLAAYGFTESAATAATLADRLEAGILSINHTGGSVSEAPSGGVKESGYGREGGAEALDAYLVTKRVSHKLR